MYKVLLVDDEEMVTQGLSRFVPWQELGFQVAGTAASVDKALDFLEQEMVDLVITDVMMPVKTGLDLIAILNSRYPAVKTVILSGYSDFAYAQQAVRLGALDYLTKPINFTAIRELLNRAREKLDEERQRSGTNDRLAQALTRSVIMNLCNGFALDQSKMAQYLDITCPITALRLACHTRQPLPASLGAHLLSVMGRCQIVSPAENELLCVLEGHREQSAVCAALEELVSLVSISTLPLCIGVSEEFPGYQALATAAVQAAKAMRYQMARCTAGVTPYSKMRQMYLSLKETSEEKITALVSDLATPDRRQNLVPEFQSVFTALEARPEVSLSTAQQFCTELLIELDAPLRELLPEEYPRHAHLSETLMEILSDHSLGDVQAHVTAYLQKILADLPHSDENQNAGELIARVKAYIQEHYAENLTLAVLSNVFFVCPAYLSRLFKKKTGINFVDYLTRLRVEKAKEFLAIPTWKVYTVAEMVGYENPRYFSRIFKDITGTSPQEYRASIGAEPES